MAKQNMSIPLNVDSIFPENIITGMKLQPGMKLSVLKTRLVKDELRFQLAVSHEREGGLDEGLKTFPKYPFDYVSVGVLNKSLKVTISDMLDEANELWDTLLVKSAKEVVLRQFGSNRVAVGIIPVQDPSTVFGGIFKGNIHKFFVTEANPEYPGDIPDEEAFNITMGGYDPTWP